MSSSIELRQFQSDAAEKALIALGEFRYGLGTSPSGIPYPCVRLISGVTGSGKTRILARIVSGLKDGTVLGTSPASAVISQTVDKLQHQYRKILGADVGVYGVEAMAPNQWNTVLGAEEGISVLVATVALYNIEDKEGRAIHDSGRWAELKEVKFSGIRKRPRLVIVYDEGHNLTPQQAN